MHPDRLRVSVGPGSLAVTRYGHADRAVLLLHGFPLSSFSWRLVAPRLAHAGWMAIVPDLLGHGESDRPLDAPIDPASQAGWVREAMGALGLARVAVVGHDLGGLVATLLAERSPDAVAHLVLVSPLAGTALPPGDVRDLQRDSGRIALRLAHEQVGAAELIDALLRGRTQAGAALDPRVVAGVTAPFVGREGVRQLLALARSLEPGAAWRGEGIGVRSPTLMLHGEHEDNHGTQAALEQARAMGARTARVPGALALAPEEAPEALGGLILEFLSSSDTVSATT